MSYAPKSLALYIAAYSGAYGAMTASGKVPKDATIPSVTNDRLAAIAGAFAQQVDTVLNGFSATLGVALIEELSYGVWEGRVPKSNDAALDPTSYNPLILAMISILESAALYFQSESIPTTIQNPTLLSWKPDVRTAPVFTPITGDVTPSQDIADITIVPNGADININMSLSVNSTGAHAGTVAMILSANDGRGDIETFLYHFDATSPNVQQLNFTRIDTPNVPADTGVQYKVRIQAAGTDAVFESAGGSSFSALAIKNPS